MIEKAFYGDKKYWSWLFFLGAVILIAFLFYMRQFNRGLTVTGLGRDVSWGFYIAQFTFLVGVAASAVMVVLPYYLHNYKMFGKITILGEFLAIPSVLMCMLFIFVDMGQPFRILNVFLHPSPNSPMFWDTVALGGYLCLNILIGFVTLGAERKLTAPPKWIKPFIIISIPWAISIHTVTAFLYSGLVARPFWMTAVLAPRFLASAFSAGPALLILLCLLLRKISSFDVGKEPIQKLAVIAIYAMCLNVFLILMEIFTTFYGGMEDHMSHFKYLFVGLDGNTFFVPWMWTSSILAIVTLILLIPPAGRKNEKILALGCITLFISIWIDKGMGMIVAGFVPNPFHVVARYVPTLNELAIALGVYAIGALIVTLLYKIVLSVRASIP
ncbi:polysulfide reductase NrfD [bacterium]|nr:polysulfide reductase NrfD [bacterium]